MRVITNENYKEETTNQTTQTKEIMPDDIEKVVEYADWMTQFGLESLGLMCTLFDVLETKIDGFDAVGASEAVAASIYHMHQLGGGLSK
jgi:hypothetical protein